jgi:hypothetical protein
MGLFENLLNLSTDQTQGLLSAGAALLRAGGPSTRPVTFGQGLSEAIGAFQQTQQQARQFSQQELLRNLQIKGAEADLASQQRALAKQQRLDDAAKGAYRTAGAQASSLPGGPTNANLARIGEFQDGFDPNAYISQVMAIDPKLGYEMQQSMKKAGPKYGNDVEYLEGPDGQPVAVRFADDGTYKVMEGYKPRDKMELANMGGRSEAYNPYALKPGQSFTRTMTPGEAASNGIARANLGLSRERLQFDQQHKAATEARAEREFALKQHIGKAPTEFQGKSAAFGLRATEADKILSELDYSPTAINSKASVASWPLIGGALGAATNKFALSESDQKAEQSQRDFINAVLRQESGAAIADSEFDNARKQYFPQPGDSDSVIAQKARTRQLSIQGLQSNAGRAAMTASPAPVSRQSAPLKSALKGQVMDGYRFKGGNPADPNAWEKL